MHEINPFTRAYKFLRRMDDVGKAEYADSLHTKRNPEQSLHKDVAQRTVQIAKALHAIKGLVNFVLEPDELTVQIATNAKWDSVERELSKIFPERLAIG